MPSNASKPFITSNSDDFQPATETETVTYYFAVGQQGANGEGSLSNGPNGQNSDSVTMNTAEFATTTIITDTGDSAGYNDWIDNVQNFYGDSSTWEYAIPTEDQFEGGVNEILMDSLDGIKEIYLDIPISGGVSQATINGYVGNPLTGEGGVDIDQDE